MDTTAPTPQLVIADFGVAKLYASEHEGSTRRDRGTEYIKAPEMLLVGSTRDLSSQCGVEGVNSRCDVWSAGCLLYEVLVGDFLFRERDWTRFYLRVTSSSLPLLTDAKLALLPAACAAEVSYT